MSDICFVECDECGQITMSFDRGKIMDEAEEHMGLYPEHELYIHVFESKVSKKL